MPTVAYATVADLSEYLTSSRSMPDDAERLLQRASDKIDDYVIAGFRTGDDDKLPTDTVIAAALRDAVCAQVEFWLEVGEGQDIDGIQGQVQVTGGGSWQAPPTLSPRARSILKRADLMNLGWVGI